MSFILDALKKSEIERQRQAVPGLIEAGMAPPRPRIAAWAIALGAALLGINLAVLLVVLLRNGNSAAPAASEHRPAAKQQTAGAPAAGAPATGSNAPRNTAPLTDAAPEHFSPMGSPVYAPEIPVPEDAGTGAAQPPIGRSAMNSAGAPAHALRRPDPSATDQSNKSDNDEVLPSISEVNLTGPAALPELHLDVHVYATRPSDRFVYINMRKYHEGDTLDEGPTLERIRRDGVVLNFQGLRFLLPRAIGQSGGSSQ